MAELVGGFLMPHNPMLTVAPDAADPSQKQVIFDAFQAIAAKVTELQADTVIIIGDDHYTNFGPHCIPTCLVYCGRGWSGRAISKYRAGAYRNQRTFGSPHPRDRLR